jgi:betaine reductase
MKVAVKGTSYCLNHAPEMALHYGNTPFVERKAKGSSEFLESLPSHLQSYEKAATYAPNLTYIGAMTLDELGMHPQPWTDHPLGETTRYGRFGEIMPEDEFLALMDISDVFDIIWLEEAFSASVAEKLGKSPIIPESMLRRLEKGHTLVEIEKEIAEKDALPLFFGGEIIGCSRKGHEIDECLEAYVLLENVACKAGGVLALLHLFRNSGLKPEEVDFVIECSEEAAGDMNQRGGGNFAKAVAEIAGCVNASGCDVRGFCAGPVNAVIAAASQVAAGARKNCVVLAGGAIPKLFMNSRDHVKKGLPALEDCLGNFAVLLAPDDGTAPVIRLDALGKHTVGAGSSPQAITSALVWEPLQKLGLGFNDVDKYAAELQNPEITLPAGAGDVPNANFKMIGALAVMKGQLEKADIPEFAKKKGIPGFVHTQGHIPSGVPFIGHACEGIKSKSIGRALVIGKGSLFLARMTNLSDGASFFIEAPSGENPMQAVSKEDIKRMLLEALSEVATTLRGE